MWKAKDATTTSAHIPTMRIEGGKFFDTVKFIISKKPFITEWICLHLWEQLDLTYNYALIIIIRW